MRVTLQKVKYAKCVVDNHITGEITNGYLLLVGFTNNDNEDILNKMAKKIINLRIFEDNNNKMNLNIKQINGNILSISQFTLYASTQDGNRPSFSEALNPDDAIVLYKRFNEILRAYDIVVEEGIFGAHMEISLLNDGPITINLQF